MYLIPGLQAGFGLMQFSELKKERAYYYPTTTLVTAPDIIFFWVARMIIAGMYFRKEIPFSDVYFTSIIRDVAGEKNE